MQSFHYNRKRILLLLKRRRLEPGKGRRKCHIPFKIREKKSFFSLLRKKKKGGPHSSPHKEGEKGIRGNLLVFTRKKRRGTMLERDEKKKKEYRKKGPPCPSPPVRKKRRKIYHILPRRGKAPGAKEGEKVFPLSSGEGEKRRSFSKKRGGS